MLISAGIVLIVSLTRRLGDLGSRLENNRFSRVAVASDTLWTKKLERHMSDTMSRLDALEQRTEADHQNLEDLRRQFAWENLALVSSQPQSEAPDPLFPSSIEKCIAIWKETNTKMLPVRHFEGHVVAAEKGEFFLVMGDSPERPLLLIPSLVRFLTKQDYYTLFEEFYRCDKVTSGEVWVIEPAVASRIQGGWSLCEKGRLDIR